MTKRDRDLVAVAFRNPEFCEQFFFGNRMIQGILQKANRDCTIIVDGYGGNVVIDPDKATIEAYIETLEKNHQIAQSLRRYIQKVAQTDDGRRVFIKANIELDFSIPEDVMKELDALEGTNLKHK